MAKKTQSEAKHTDTHTAIDLNNENRQHQMVAEQFHSTRGC